MSFLKSYFAPSNVPGDEKTKQKKRKKNDDAEIGDFPAPAMEMTKNGPPPSLSIKSAFPSRPASLYPDGDFRNAPRESILDIKVDVMASWLHQQQLEALWATELPGEGVVLKKAREAFACYPASLQNEQNGFFDNVAAMNVRSAMTVNTRVIKLFLTRHNADYVPISSGLRLQVLPSLDYLPRCQKHHFGAFIQDRLMLVVWDDEPKKLLDRAAHIEESLLKMIWGGGEAEALDEKKSANVSMVDLGDGMSGDLEDPYAAEYRPTMLITAIQVALTLAMLLSTLGLGWRALAQQVAIDGKFIRLALLACVPAQMFVSLFFMQVIVTNLLQVFGPISQMHINSKFFSGVAPRQLDRTVVTLPHVTIQMPVYKEGLVGVIQPTIMSLKAAISTYELQGGTANIFVNDDGMQLISESDAQARRDFYEEHSIGWVARPKHNPKPEGDEIAFIRRGKFKKASNMNYALMVSNKVEEKLVLTERTDSWNQEDEYAAYDKALAEVLVEEEGRAWAEGNIRVGDYILLIDSDTRVPKDCLLDAASEMEQCPEVGILQYSSGVMQVTDSFFENGITYFTNLIYTAIRYAIANGDISPFVGHNAILRWSAIQTVAFTDEDGYEKYWSESHVSEDFDMSLRLQVEGYTIRLGAYPGDGFKEGVSLTVYDELNRWEKYAFGCNELLFHPIYKWPMRGPFTPLFRKFIFSPIRFTTKVTNLAYIGNYYGIAAAWVLTLSNYFLMGWFNGYLDKYYLDSFKVYFSLVIVFGGLGNVSLAVLRYRLSERSLFSSLFENFKWLPLMTIFMGGISIHVFQAIVCHFLGIEMTWGATAKEVEEVTFFEELPRLLKRFKWTFLFCFACTGGMVAGALFVPWNWRITEFTAIFPLSTVVVGHFLLPITLNPALMMFTW